MGQAFSGTQNAQIRWKYLGVLYLMIFTNLALASDNSLGPRGDINPVWEKFGTKADHDMPGNLGWGLLDKHNLSYWDDGNWILSSTQPMQGMFPANRGLSNGYIGAAVSQIGPFFDRDVNQTNHYGAQPREGWPLFNIRQTFATVAGFFTSQPTTKGTNFPELQELGWESVIAGVPHFLGMKLAIGHEAYDAEMDLSSLSNFVTTTDFRKGRYDWNATWSPKGVNATLDLEYTSFVHRNRPNVAGTQLKATPRGGDVNCTVVDIFDGRSAVRSYPGERGISASSMHISVHPDGLPNVTSWMVSTANVSNVYTNEASRKAVIVPDAADNMTMGQAWDVHLINGETAIFQKFVGIASTDKFPDANKTAHEESTKAFNDGWPSVLSEHEEAWEKIMVPSRIASYRDPVTGRLPPNETLIEKLQIAAVADSFYLMQNLQPMGSGLDDAGVAVGGLTSDTYGGMMFWDQDFWMFPAIGPTWPQYSRFSLLARLRHLLQAKLNAQAPYVQADYKFPADAALYSWTAGRFGNATGTGPAKDYEYHLNSDIALEAFQYRQITGDEVFFREQLWPMVLAIGKTIDILLVPDGEGYSIYNMTDPDEYQNNAKNGAFTLASFSTVLTQISKYQREYGLPVNETWDHKAANVNIRKAESGITLECEGMSNNLTVKQADVTLTGLLNWGSLEEQWQNLAYYDQKQSPDGPAMTHAISTIAMNQIAKSGCSAFTRQLKAQLPNLRAPWFQMSEQADDDQNSNGGVSPSFPFLTGSGGSLQIPLYGYLGHTWLKNDLTIRPALPAPLKHLQIADFHFKGNLFRASMNSTHTNMTRLPAQGPGLYDAFKGQPMPLIVERRVRGVSGYVIAETAYNISMNQTITVKNDMYWQEFTVPNNLLQCQPTTTGGSFIAANPPGAATDGDAGTRWQPLTQKASNITIETNNVPSQRITELYLDFGPRTPKYVRVAFTNRTDLESIWDAKPIILEPIPKAMPNDKVALYQGNTTTYNITEGYWSGKYAILEVEGCQGCGALLPVTFDNGTTYWQDDGLGAFVAEFAAVGQTGIDLVQNLKEVSADERQDGKGDVMDAQDAHASALTDSLELAGIKQGM